MLAVEYYVLKYLRKNYILALAILFNIFSRLYSSSCDNLQTMQISPLYTDLKPVETFSKEVRVTSRIRCAVHCYNDVSCTGFFFNKDDGVCSVYHTSFRSMAFVTSSRTVAFGKIALH